MSTFFIDFRPPFVLRSIVVKYYNSRSYAISPAVINIWKLYFIQPIVVNSPDTTLADLLNLQLHDFEDEVKNIVDKAVKEMSMEKTIKVVYVAVITKTMIRNVATWCMSI